jgi:hypothetical protein
MSVRRVAVLVGLAIAPAAAMAASGPRTVGFANLGGQAAEASIEEARGELKGHGYKGLDSGALRASLEEPLPAGSAGGVLPLGRARNHLAAAREAFAGFEYDHALAELAHIDELLIDREPSQPLIDILVQRHLLAGQVHEGRNKPDEALDSFRLVRHLDPGRGDLDPGEYRPRVVSLYRKSRATRANGTLALEVTPEGAQVWIDGRSMGRAPVEASGLGPGPHWVVASALGRRPQGELISITAGKRRAVALELQTHPATDRITELRRALATASSRDELEAGAAQLAGAAEVDVMVMVRGRGDRVEGAAFDTARGELGAWAPLPSRGFWLVLTPSQAMSEEDGDDDGTDGSLTRDDGDKEDPRSWYQKGWGKGLIIGGGVVITGVILYAVLTGGEDTYTLGSWCFSGEECQ